MEGVTNRSLGRVVGSAVWLAALMLIYGRDLYSLGSYAINNELHSHIVPIPFISAYLIYIQRPSLPRESQYSFVPFVLLAAIGTAVTFLAYRWHSSISDNDYFSLIALAVILLVIAGGFLFLGSHWMKAVIFPAAFLFFAIPMPDGMANTLENWSKLGSAETASWFFALAGVPVVRDGVFFQMPGITIQVAQECSGIRSSWVLLITSALASYLFLRTTSRRLALVLIVLPLGLLRNGFRIVVIGWLCVNIDPSMIDSPIHHKGGPIFFVLSLIPLFLLLQWLRKSERTVPRIERDAEIG